MLIFYHYWIIVVQFGVIQLCRVLKELINSGEGLSKLKELIQAQGGNTEMVDDTELLPAAKFSKTISSEQSGYVAELNALKAGLASVVTSVLFGLNVFRHVANKRKVRINRVVCRIGPLNENSWFSVFTQVSFYPCIIEFHAKGSQTTQEILSDERILLEIAAEMKQYSNF